MVKYEKPSGVIVEINDSPDNIAAAKAHGWKPAKKAPKKAKGKK